ncbi:MAG: AAA family ATPase [Clostridia bacterium]|nr:AAA family ATPase [Clostridia bacterium]
MNLLLIGMPGCGKSTLGVLLAKTMGLQFIDTDLLIQKQEGRLLQQVIDEDGLAAFLKAEERALLSIDTDRTLIATGGSAVYSDAGMRHLKKNAYTVFMYVKKDVLLSRLKDSSQRGIAIPAGMTLEELYAEREPLYRSYAEHVFCENGGDIVSSMERLRKFLQSKNIF